MSPVMLPFMLPSRKTCYHNACGLDRQLELGYAGTLVVQSRFRRLVSVCVAMDHRAAAMLITSQDGHYNQSAAFQSTVALTAMSRVPSAPWSCENLHARFHAWTLGRGRRRLHLLTTFCCRSCRHASGQNLSCLAPRWRGSHAASRGALLQRRQSHP